MKYAEHVNRKVTPQSEPIPGSPQVENSAGGYSFAVDDWSRLRRFLILGSEGGSYYAGERKLTKENAACVERCVKGDGPRAVAIICDVSEAGRAPKNDPAILALATALKLGDAPTRALARAAVPRVCRTGTHLLHLAACVDALGGWGRGTRRAFADWFNSKPADRAAYQCAKYQSRDEWAMRDLLRLAHPTPPSAAHDRLYRWVVKGEYRKGAPWGELDPLRVLEGFERAKAAGADAKVVARLVRDYRLPRECVPTEALKSPPVWEALLDEPMGITALVRNLGNMTRLGVLAPLGERTLQVCERLASADELKRGRVHPLAMLVAQRTYGAGRSEKGKHTWTPIQNIVDALDAGFYAAFGAVEPSGKRTMLAIDISSSMDGGQIAGCAGISPRVGAAAMALVTAATEPRHMIVGFTAGSRPGRFSRSHNIGDGLSTLAISPRQRLADVVRHMQSLHMGGTDCALPMIHAREQGLEVDAFVIYTDSETWAGSIHPAQALAQYRKASGIPARLVVVGMVANPFTIADPADRGMLDVVGFDAGAPQLISDFSAGAL